MYPLFTVISTLHAQFGSVRFSFTSPFSISLHTLAVFFSSITALLVFAHSDSFFSPSSLPIIFCYCCFRLFFRIATFLMWWFLFFFSLSLQISLEFFEQFLWSIFVSLESPQPLFLLVIQKIRIRMFWCCFFLLSPLVSSICPSTSNACEGFVCASAANARERLCRSWAAGFLCLWF